VVAIQAPTNARSRRTRAALPAADDDMIFALTSSDLVEGLTGDRRWSRDKLAAHLATLLRATFLRDDGTRR
jgi:hypothetical protein